MARLLGSFRLLWLLTQRDLKSLSSLGLNNLFFCAIFLMQGSGTPRTAVLTTLPFLLVLSIPLLLALCMETLTRIPAVRAGLFPLNTIESVSLRCVASILSPSFWLFGGILTAWMGIAVGIAFVLLLALMQLLIFVAAKATHSLPSLRSMQPLPAPPGKLPRLIQLNLRLNVRSLDVWAAMLLSLAGSLYRFFYSSPQPDAYPILAILVAIAMSTYTQRSFGLESPGSMVRYRLLPIPAVQILFAKDIAYMILVAVVTLPLSLKPAMAFSLIAISVGRIPSLRQNIPQVPWRFTGGDPRYGLAQVLIGGLMAMATIRVSNWFIAPCVVVYAISLLWGHRTWQKLYN